MQQNAGDYVQPTGAGQTITYTGTAGVIGNPLPPGTQYAWIWCTTAAFIAWGASPTATTADFPIPPNWPIKVFIGKDSTGASLDGKFKVSAVQLASGGSLMVAPVQY